VPHRAMCRSRTCAGLTRGRTFSSSPMVFVHARQKSRRTSLRRKVLAGTPSRTTELVTGRTRTAASTGAQASRSATAVRESIAGEYREDRMSVRDARVGRAVDNGSRRGLVVTLEKRAFSRSGRFRRLRRRIFSEKSPWITKTLIYACESRGPTSAKPSWLFSLPLFVVTMTILPAARERGSGPRALETGADADACVL
jgi:hypothetical protein